MVPIYIGTDYTPEDWFEIRAGSATWVRFRDQKSDEEVMEILLGLINVRDKVKQNDKKRIVSHESNFQKKSEIEANSINNTQTIEISLPVNSNPIAKTPKIQLESNSSISNIISTSLIEEWTSEEVQRWLRLPPSILQLSSGRALLTYMKLLSHDDAQYDEYEQRMRDHGISREQFSNLISSFKSILALNSKKTSSTDQWTREEIKCWFQQNHLSDHLINTLGFINGSQLILYGKLILDSTVRINEEYDRLRNKIGQDLFHLDDYVRFLDCLKTLVSESQPKQEQASCNIL